MIIAIMVCPVAAATVVVTPDNPAAMERGVAKEFGACVEKFNKTGFGDLLNLLNRSGNTWVIKRKQGTSGATPNSESDANKKPDGQDGKGTGGVIQWDPDNFDVMEATPLVTQEPCATLYHEMAHAVNYDKGIRDATPCFTIKDGKVIDTNMTKEEVNAIQKENAFRAAQTTPPLPLRTNHGKPNQTMPDPKVGCVPKPPDPEPPPKPTPGCGAGCAIGTGEPHLRTFDGLDYDLQAVGEFVLTRAPGGMEVQGRMSPLAGLRTVSVFAAAAVRVGPDRVGIYRGTSGLSVRLGDGGSVVDVASGATRLAGGGLVRSGPEDSVEVRWPDGSALVVSPLGARALNLRLQLADARKAAVEGLFGNFDGRPDGDRVVRSGPPLPAEPSFDDVYKRFADSWRVNSQTSLFHYGPGESTDSFTDRSFPDKIVTAASLPNRATAEALCRRAGVTDETLMQNCILDVGLTGELAYAKDAAHTQRMLSTGSGTTLSITQPGASADLRFDGAAGQKVFVDVPSSTLADECGVITLRDPAGLLLAQGCVINGSGNIDATVLPVAGRYTVRLESAERHTGAAVVNVVTATDETARITPGGSAVTTAINQPGAVSRVRFTGQRGQKVFVDAESSTLPDECAVIGLLDTAGQKLASGCMIGGTGYIDGTVLPADGDYTVLVDAGGRSTGTTRLKVINSHDQAGTVTVGGPAVVANIAQPGAVSRFTFDARSGQRIGLDVSRATLPDECSPVGILDPAGASLASSCIINGSGAVPTTTVPATGRYTVVVDPGARATGTARLQLNG